MMLQVCCLPNDAHTQVMIYINPYMVDVEAQGKPRFKRNLFKEAQAKQCLIKAADEKDLIQSIASPDVKFGTIDLSQPSCQEWYISIIQQNLMLLGTDNSSHPFGWMADFSEV